MLFTAAAFKCTSDKLLLLFCLAKVIQRQGRGLKSHPIDWWSQESNLQPLSGLSTTPQHFRLEFFMEANNMNPNQTATLGAV